MSLTPSTPLDNLTSVDLTSVSEPPSTIRSAIPEFFIIGQPKTGTTALWTMLRQHPDIFMPDNKEPFFFNSDLRWISLPFPRLGFSDLSLAEYISLFRTARPGQISGEASTCYLVSHTAARNIAEFNPSARLIAILREPVELLRSFHTHLLDVRVESIRDLKTAVDLEEDRRGGHRIPKECWWPDLLLYSQLVRYVQQLERYRERFPPDQILTIIYDDFLHDNEATLKRIFTFLGVDPSVRIEPVQANVKAVPRSHIFDAALRRLTDGRGPALRLVKRSMKSISTQQLRHRLLDSAYSHKSRPHPLVDPALEVELRRRFRPEVVRLSEYLGRDLVRLWKYQ